MAERKRNYVIIIEHHNGHLTTHKESADAIGQAIDQAWAEHKRLGGLATSRVTFVSEEMDIATRPNLTAVPKEN